MSTAVMVSRGLVTVVDMTTKSMSEEEEEKRIPDSTGTVVSDMISLVKEQKQQGSTKQADFRGELLQKETSISSSTSIVKKIIQQVSSDLAVAHDEDYTDETRKETHLHKKIVSMGETTSRHCSSRTSTSVAVAASTSQETVATSDKVSEEPEINMFGTVMVTTSN